MPNKPAALDQVFHALGDPTRRAVLARLCQGPATVSDLAAPFRMALPSFVQHLAVLEKSGLIASAQKGRVRTCHVKKQQLAAAENWISQQRALWERRLDQFDAYVKTLKNTGEKK
jgi:DNA-binding transcriptional ArsR family regulator